MIYQSNNSVINFLTQYKKLVHLSKLQNDKIITKNNDNKCFQYSITLSLYHQEIKHNSQRISMNKPYVNNFNWKNINFPPTQQDYRTFEININSVALNILQINDQQKISHYYKSQYNKTRESKIILLMITDNNKQNAGHSPHYIFVKKLNTLLKNSNKHNTSYFRINYLKKFTTKLEIEKHYQKDC